MSIVTELEEIGVPAQDYRHTFSLTLFSDDVFAGSVECLRDVELPLAVSLLVDATPLLLPKLHDLGNVVDLSICGTQFSCCSLDQISGHLKLKRLRLTEISLPCGTDGLIRHLARMTPLDMLLISVPDHDLAAKRDWDLLQIGELIFDE